MCCASTNLRAGHLPNDGLIWWRLRRLLLLGGRSEHLVAYLWEQVTGEV
jgi:hypothetical protein